ncbi:MAG TPA: hypothetical protein VHM20_05580 [Gammaproteobacteria bacterium]|jgi:hypothetical protein|nr:hypothetical protein [Gammaproteobacteria bacterium]
MNKHIQASNVQSNNLVFLNRETNHYIETIEIFDEGKEKQQLKNLMVKMNKLKYTLSSINGLSLNDHLTNLKKSVANNILRKETELSETEKDVLKELAKKDVTQRQLIGFYRKKLHNPDCNLKSLATEFNIKTSWANTVYEIGRKLVWQNNLLGQTLSI